jgi:integrase
MRAKIRRRKTASGSVRWYVSTLDDSGTEEAHGGYSTKRQAKAKAAAIITDAERGRYVSPASLTVGDYLKDEWLPSRENADLSASTRDTERTIVEAWILPHLGGIPLQKLSARDLDTLASVLRKRGGRGGRPLRGKSVRNARGVLSKALGDAVRRGYIVANPVLAVDVPTRDDSVERRAWTKEEVVQFLPVAAADRLGSIWRLSLATGLRRGEVLGLTWSDVDLDERRLAVRRQVLVRPRPVKDSPRVYIRETTKTRRVRLVRFDEATADALRRWKAAQAEERLAFGGAWKVDGGLACEADWIVTEPDGQVVHPDTLLKRWRRLTKIAGVPDHAARRAA